MEEKPQNEKTHQLKYFIDNKIVDSNSSKSISEHYLSIPFKIFSLLFKSFTEDSVKITNNLSLSKNIWDEKYFKNTNINNISQKKDIFILYTFRMEVFLLQYKKKRKITRELGDNMSDEELKDLIEKTSRNKVELTFEEFCDIMNKKNFS